MVASQSIGGRENIVFWTSGCLCGVIPGDTMWVKDRNVENGNINIMEEKRKNSHNFAVGRVFYNYDQNKTKQNKSLETKSKDYEKLLTNHKSHLTGLSLPKL